MTIKARRIGKPRKTREVMPDFKNMAPKVYLAEGDTPWDDFQDLDPTEENALKPHFLSREATSEVIADGLGQRIRNAMVVLKIDQTELAEYVGYTRANVNKVIMGRHNPSLPLLVKLADKLDVSVDYLLGRKIRQSELGAQLVDMQRVNYTNTLLINIVVRILTDSRIEKLILGERKSLTSKSVLEGVERIISEFRQTKEEEVEEESS